MGRVAPGTPGAFGPHTYPLPLPAPRRPSTVATRLFGPAFPNGLTPLVTVDSWGAITLPAQGQGDGAALGDPALSRTLAFLYAYLVTDGVANAPWTAEYNVPLIAGAPSLYPHAPADTLAGAFNESYLPSLFLWRGDGGEMEQAAEDYLLDRSMWTLLWVMPLGVQENQVLRSTYVNLFAKAVTAGLSRARTPGYVLQGDPDPTAATRGSYLWDAVNCEMQYVKKWKPTKLIVEVADRVPADSRVRSSLSRPYKAVEIKIAMVERLHESIDRFGTRGVGLDLSTFNQYGQRTGRTIQS